MSMIFLSIRQRRARGDNDRENERDETDKREREREKRYRKEREPRQSEKRTARRCVCVCLLARVSKGRERDGDRENKLDGQQAQNDDKVVRERHTTNYYRGKMNCERRAMEAEKIKESGTETDTERDLRDCETTQEHSPNEPSNVRTAFCLSANIVLVSMHSPRYTDHFGVSKSVTDRLYTGRVEDHLITITLLIN